MAELPLMPCVERNVQRAVLAAPRFAYLGTPLTLAEFVSYLASYDFGSIAPDQVVLHNTANPDASWAPLGTSDAAWWDRDEAGMSLTAIRNKRNKQLDAIKAYYVSLGWDAGPHLFIDERWIWLFTPLNTVGVHAKEGNSYRDSAGKLHYTIGCEFVGWFGKRGWPASMQALARGAVQALRAQIKTFDIVYKPAPPHTPAAHQGSVAFHRDYNKPACPGAVITPAYAIPILSAPPPPVADPWPARWGPIATPAGEQWGWANAVYWKSHWERLGPCRSHLLYDNEHQCIMQCFERGVIRQLSNAAWEGCYL